MVTGDKVRLNHELLIWRGFTRHGRIWAYPDGVDIDNGTPYFPEDIKACFKYLVPKAIDIYKGRVNGSSFFAWKWLLDSWLPYLDNDEPALALCLAIQELIRSK